MMKVLRYLLLPFAILYGLVIRIRNFFYDRKIMHSVAFDLPVICIGNLAVGGSGKTPMVEYLIGLLAGTFPTAVLSRGYKRKTKGILIASEGITAEQIGDEPMQFYSKYSDRITVAVSESRVPAIPAIVSHRPEIKCIILDDAFQHRAVRAGLNILLTTESNLYVDDMMLPTGNLRDEKNSSKRAQIVVVTKCRPDLSAADKERITDRLQLLPSQSLFFTQLTYGKKYSLFDEQEEPRQSAKHILLVTGIAHSRYLFDYLAESCKSVKHLDYKDHHTYSERDIDEITRLYHSIPDEGQKIIITTEKDAVKLNRFKNKLKSVPVFVQPVQHTFLFDEGGRFDQAVLDFVQNFEWKD